MRPAERYRLIERLGAGSVGVVHRALDRVTGREVALKIMPRPRTGTNLRGEFVALARLRHPNVVSVLDYGLTDAGHEYFTMELVAGPSLLEAATPATGRRCFALLGGVLDALSAVHAGGMVHADIKPSNILVDGGVLESAPDRAARLVDFGLAAPLADPSGPTARGTIGHAAPEAWSGRLDPRSDLYSFGVVLWQLVMGARPFAGATARAVVAAQRAGAPPDPRRLRPDLPPALAELMVALLDPAPGARPQTADEVLERWRAIADGLGHHRLPGARGLSVRSPRVAIEVGTILGREHELADLERAWAEARAGRGAAVLVVGEPGIGKTRLCAELALRLQLEGAQVVRWSARAGDQAWEGVRELVRTLLALAGEAWSARGGPAASHQGVAALLAGAPAPQGPGRWVVAESVAELVVAAGAAQPLTILVDDLDAAAPATIDVLAYLARAVPDAAVLLVAAGRSATPGRAPTGGGGGGGGAFEQAVAGAARGRRYELAPLGQSSFFALAVAAVGAEVGVRLADELRRVSGGNPGHALATLEAMIENGSLARVGGAWITGREVVVPLLAAARQGAMARLSALAPPSRALLRAAAVLGDSFDRDVLSAILGITAPPVPPAAADGVPEELSEGIISVSTQLPVAESSGDDERSRRVAIDPTFDDLEAALADGVAARVLTADPAAGRFRFAHKELADALGRELTPGARLEYHRRAALALEDRLAAGGDVPAAALARHYRALGDGTLAARWCLAAADEAARGGDLGGALAHATDALTLADPVDHHVLVRRVAELAAQHGDLDLALHHFRLAGDGAAPAEQIELALEIAEVERRRGETARALEAATSALALARRLGDLEREARSHLRIGWLFTHKGDFAAAAEHAAIGLALARRAASRGLAAELGRLSAAVATSQGDPRRAIAILDDALADADGDPRLDAGISHEIGRAAIQAGDYARAVAALERAVAAAERHGDLVQRARSLNNLAAASYYQGDWARARRLWEQFRQQTERQGDRLETLYALNNLGSLLRDLGALAEARATFGRAATLAEELGHRHMAAMVEANRGEVDARGGELAMARERYERALAEFEQIGARDDAIEARRRLSELDLTVGRVDEALSRALEAARDAKGGSNRFEEGVLHRVAATALRCQGDHESAGWFLARARELLAGLGARYELARVAFEAAELARATSDLGQARAQLAAAEAELAGLGARWDLERVRALARALGPVAEIRGGLDLDSAAVARAAAAGDADRAIDLALDGVLAAAGCSRGFVLTLDGQGRPRVRARRLRAGARTFARDDAAVSGTIVRKVAASGQAVAVADAVLDEDLRDESSVVALGLRRVYAAPLRARGRLAGIVYVDSLGADVDDRVLDLAQLDAVTAPLALALDHGRLLDDAHRASELMSILAHEIRNPLAGILGYSEMGSEPELAGDTLPPAELFGRIRHDAERLRRLVDNVFELARHESGNIDWSMAPVEVGKLVADVAHGFARVAAARRVGIALELDEPIGPAMGNADRLAQVVSNLLGNAVKFSPEGGRIELRVRRETVRAGDPVAPPIPPADPRAWIPTEAGDEIGEVIRVDVVDHGPGMSAELQTQLFEKFTQGAGAARRGGLGLGLYLCREIVRRHGGSIWVESALGRGATFSVRLPVAL
ncbi:MAG: protein kinase [Myxococcales bacterium]|nr:protein kinase [Myxococcales bacterium]